MDQDLPKTYNTYFTTTVYISDEPARFIMSFSALNCTISFGNRQSSQNVFLHPDKVYLDGLFPFIHSLERFFL